MTSAYELPSSYVIHAVGPIYGRVRHKGKDEPARLLRSCYRTSLDLAAKKGGSIAFSCISTGVYGYPSQDAAEVASDEVRLWLQEDEERRIASSSSDGAMSKPAIERVIFCCFLEKDEKAYRETLP